MNMLSIGQVTGADGVYQIKLPLAIVTTQAHVSLHWRAHVYISRLVTHEPSVNERSNGLLPYWSSRFDAKIIASETMLDLVYKA